MNFKQTNRSAAALALALTITLAGCTQTPAGQSAADSDADPTPAVQLSGDVSGEIKVSCYDSYFHQTFLEEAAAKFEEAYPGTKVTVESFSAMPEIKTMEDGENTISMVAMEDDPQGRADYIHKLSAQLMSGAGPDLIATDVPPIHKYASAGFLENLAGYMESDPDFNSADYRQNILDALSFQGGTWFLPLDYVFSYYSYDSSLLQDPGDFGPDSARTLSELLRMGESSLEPSGDAQIYGAPAEWLPEVLIADDYNAYIDLENARAHFDDGRFEQLLAQVKEYADKGYIPDQTSLAEAFSSDSDGDAFEIAAIPRATERHMFKESSLFSLQQQLEREAGINTDRNISLGMGGGIEDNDKIAGMRADASGVPFSYTQGYAINAGSGNKETAWAFLRFMMSEEMQQSPSLTFTGLPLHNGARQNRMEMILSGAIFGLEGDTPQVDSDLLARFSDTVEQMSAQINTLPLRDTVVDDMVRAETAYFFDGSKTAAQVAATLQSKVELYLNE